MPARCPYLNARAQLQTRFFFIISFSNGWIFRACLLVFFPTPQEDILDHPSLKIIFACCLWLSTLASSSLATCMHVGLRCTICSHFYTKRLSHPSTPQMKKDRTKGGRECPNTPRSPPRIWPFATLYLLACAKRSLNKRNSYSNVYSDSTRSNVLGQVWNKYKTDRFRLDNANWTHIFYH